MIMQIIVRFLTKSLSPANLILLGNLLIEAGNAILGKQQTVNEALAHVQRGINALTK